MGVNRVKLKLSSEGTYTAQMTSGSIELGQNALKPMELLLSALAGCSGVDVYTILRKKRQKINDIEIEVQGIRRDKHPKIYESINLKFIFKGENIDPKAVERAIELSINKYCSVYAMLNCPGKTRIEVNYEIWEEKD